jgi:hypothetical protein
MRSGLVLIVVLTLQNLSYAQPPATPAASADEMFTLDGKKNPELVPQWALWRVAFMMIRQAQDIPSDVIFVTSKEEHAVISKDAEADAAFYKDCASRAAKLREPFAASSSDPAQMASIARQMQPKFDEIEMECRQHTLDVRNHALAALRPTGQNALTVWVESLKPGFKAVMRKADLPSYRLPE